MIPSIPSAMRSSHVSNTSSRCRWAASSRSLLQRPGRADNTFSLRFGVDSPCGSDGASGSDAVGLNARPIRAMRPLLCDASTLAARLRLLGRCVQHAHSFRRRAKNRAMPHCDAQPCRGKQQKHIKGMRTFARICMTDERFGWKFDVWQIAATLASSELR